ncbi:hypothetical protein ACFX1X_039174 [Malus domestica]
MPCTFNTGIVSAQNASNPQELNVKRSNFPNDFLFGVTTAAAQIRICKRSRKRPKCLAEVKALKDLGVDSHKFSISWNRILPSK